MGKCVTVDLDQLLMGRPLPGDIFDTHGRLLLSSGTEMTADVKRKLRDRGVREAVVDESMLSTMTLCDLNEEALVEFEDKLNDIVENAFATGMFQVKNTGPSISGRVVQHGCRDYSSSHQQAVGTEQRRSTNGVRRILDGVVKRKNLDVTNTREIADTCIELLAQDIGGTLCSTLRDLSANSLEEHAVKLAVVAMAIGIELGLDQDNARQIGVAGLLADVGMTQIPEEITTAERRLTIAEYVLLQRHPIHAADRLERMSGIPHLTKIIAYQVHERPDGTGYPRGRTEATIHQFARILHVADSYVAMTSVRPYRPPVLPYIAMKALLGQAQRNKVEPACVRALLRLLSLFPLGSLVALSDGSVAQTFRANGEDFNNPIVAVLLNAQGERLEPDDESVLLDLAQSELTIVQALPKPCREMVTTEERAVSAWDYCLDKQAHDQRTVDRESAAQDSVDHDSIDQPTVDQDSTDQDSVDHDSIDQEAVAT